jgi:hypothetical protein
MQTSIQPGGINVAVTGLGLGGDDPVTDKLSPSDSIIITHIITTPLREGALKEVGGR